MTDNEWQLSILIVETPMLTSTVTVLGAGVEEEVFILYSGKTREMAQADANSSSRVVTSTTDSFPFPGNKV